MDTISFPRAWKQHFGFPGASVLSFLVAHEDGRDWFPAPTSVLKEELGLHNTSLNSARLRLVAGGVISVRKDGQQYMYQINHDQLDQIAAQSAERG